MKMQRNLLGSLYKGRFSGSMGHFGIYSFNGNKIITTSSGGMLVSNDTDALAQARFLATQARDPAIHYQHSQLGYNYRLSNVLAGIGRAQLGVLEQRVEQRRAIFNRYYDVLGKIPGFHFMPELANTRSNRWLTALTINEMEAKLTSKQLLLALENENIEARPVWKPLHLQPLFAGYPYYPHEEDCSVSDQLFERGICLPSGSGMSQDEQQRVLDCIMEALDHAEDTGNQKRDPHTSIESIM